MDIAFSMRAVNCLVNFRDEGLLKGFDTLCRITVYIAQSEKIVYPSTCVLWAWFYEKLDEDVMEQLLQVDM